MATRREIMLEAALFEIMGIADNAIAPYDDGADAKLDRINKVLYEDVLSTVMLEIHDEQGPH